MRMRTIPALLAAAVVAIALAGCDERSGSGSNRHWVQLPPRTMSLMAEKGMSRYDPILIRSYKKESELEVWKKGRNGQYALLKTFPMCRWSGQLGPKVKEGDRQAPEGFYSITPAQMNPNSSFYLSYNMGFPNTFDRAYGRTGSHLMVHGACSSRGCYSMTDEQMGEIYALVRDAHSGGQQSVQMQALPFRMSAENLAKHRFDPHMAFWKNLKEGVDHFEVTKQEPKVAVCGRRYVFNADPKNGGRFESTAACPALEVDEAVAQAVAQKQREDQVKVAELVAKGTPAIRLVYDDGDQHQSFREVIVAQSALGDSTTSPVIEQRSRVSEVSRPEAIAAGPREILLDDKGRPKPTPVPVIAATPAAVPARPATAQSVATRAAPNEAAVAAAQPAAPVSGERPLYQRMLSPIGNLLGFGSSQPSGTEAETASPAGAPVPPRAPAARQRISAAPNL